MVNARTPCDVVSTVRCLGHGDSPERGPPERWGLAGRDSNPNFQGQNLASCH
jgi:hypothetical protein